MPNKNLSSHLIVINCEHGKPTKESLKELFFDLDFTENEEYFREDTIELGFECEADRVITELLEDEELTPIEIIESCVDKQIDSTGFYLDSNTSTHTIDDGGLLDKIIVSIAYISES